MLNKFKLTPSLTILIVFLAVSINYVIATKEQDNNPATTSAASAAASNDDFEEIPFTELLTSNWQIPVAMITAFILAYSVGANDVANPFGTAVGSGALTVKQVYIMATIFETAGAALLGLVVAKTIRNELIFVDKFTVDLFVLGEICAMFGAAAWQIIATIFGLPVSGTHSIVGATCGFALVEAGMAAVQWMKIGKIVASWFFSPLMAGGLAVALYLYIIKARILEAEDAEAEKAGKNPKVKSTLFWLPIFYAATVGFNIWAIGTKGLKMFFKDFYNTASASQKNTAIFGTAGVLAIVTYVLVKYLKLENWYESANLYNSVINDLDEQNFNEDDAVENVRFGFLDPRSCYFS